MHNINITHRGWQRIFLVYLGILLGIIVSAYARFIPAQLTFFPLYDKIGHFVLLGSAAYLAHRASNRKYMRIGGLALPLGPLLVALVALGEECLQSFSPYRTFSMLDYACDLGGITLFYVVDWLQERKGRT
ncbi:MAG TPA: VanZ family protein [Roseiflexaceae bacterium]|jgi:VanZ family protein|nr:VanZ family protein [Roseiflexaceae bacterium]